MIFRITLKDPDALYEAIEEALDKVKVEGIENDDEMKAILEIRSEKAKDCASKWFEYGEYVTLEMDTDKGTCIVVHRE